MSKAKLVVPAPPKKISWKKVALPSKEDIAAAPVGTVFFGLEEDDEAHSILVKLAPGAWALSIDFGYAMVLDEWRENAKTPPKAKELMTDAEVLKALKPCDVIKKTVLAE